MPRPLALAATSWAREAIVVDFERVEAVIIREVDGSIVSPSQQMGL
jgi:hypothetical protein